MKKATLPQSNFYTFVKLLFFLNKGTRFLLTNFQKKNGKTKILMFGLLLRHALVEQRLADVQLNQFPSSADVKQTTVLLL